MCDKPEAQAEIQGQVNRPFGGVFSLLTVQQLGGGSLLGKFSTVPILWRAMQAFLATRAR